MTGSNLTEQQMLSNALHYLKYRSRSKYEMFNYLKRMFPDASEDNIQHVVTKLYDLDLINDERFVLEWIQSQLNKGKGPYIIKQQLAHFQVDPTIVSQQLEAINSEDLLASAKHLIHKKEYLFKNLNINNKSAKIRNYLYQRGYPNQVTRMVIDAES
jgi:SOS response regulatory protein OraA/RecX